MSAQRISEIPCIYSDVESRSLMNILGITHPISLNPAACLISNGALVAFVEEERFSRLKHAPHSHPANAIEFCLKQAGLAHEDIQITAIGFERPDEARAEAVQLQRLLANELSNEDRFQHSTALALFHYDAQIDSFGERQYFDHHLCHAASAAIPSGYAESNIITLDGWGGSSCGMLGYFDLKNGFKRDVEIGLYRSWGIVYELITDLLGFQFHSGEGKTMGLASFGQVKKEILPDFTESELGLPDVQEYENWVSSHIAQRKAGDVIEERHCDLAATLQFYYERSLVRIAQWLNSKSGNGKFAMAGGVALNCTGNGLLAEQTFVEDLFVQPASHDAGTALGAAILAHNQAFAHWPELGFTHAYWGPNYSNEDIVSALEFSGVRYIRCDPVEAAAELLAKNEIIGWFQGASEVGPRALGNRSILANPGFVDNLRRVNEGVKRRETWRPLAPSVLAERYHEVFDAQLVSRYMLQAEKVKEAWRERIPAVVHTDGSARPQAVFANDNAIYHKLLQRFEDLTGLPALLNTSYNLNDEPMVNSPENAIATFFRSGLCALVIGDCLVRKL